jgi:hypothetical protein
MKRKDKAILHRPMERNEVMAKKDMSKPLDKEVYRLWWEYLKRSENYKAYCNAVREVIKIAQKRGEPNSKIIKKLFAEDSPYPELMEKYFAKGLSLKKDDFTVSAKIIGMNRNWQAFGDVFVDSFDDWWKVTLTMDFSIPLVVLNDPDAVKALPMFVEECKRLKEERKKFPSPKEMIDIITQSEREYLFIAVPMVGNMTMETISKKIADARAMWKRDDDFLYFDFLFKRFFMPVGRVRFEELKRYLQVYDLKQEGLKMKDIIAKVDPSSRGEDVHVLRAFRSDLQKAKKIIANVESGCFPEMPITS